MFASSDNCSETAIARKTKETFGFPLYFTPLADISHNFTIAASNNTILFLT